MLDIVSSGDVTIIITTHYVEEARQAHMVIRQYCGPSLSVYFRMLGMYHKTSNKHLASNKSRPLIGAGCTGTLNLKNASNYIPLINACLQ